MSFYRCKVCGKAFGQIPAACSCGNKDPFQWDHVPGPPVQYDAEYPQAAARPSAKKSGKGGFYIAIAALSVLLIAGIGLLVHRQAAGRWLWEPKQGSAADKNETELPGPASHRHKYEESARTEPTCDKPGSVQKTCRGCGDVVTEDLEPLGHSWTDATCTKAKTCERCGETSGTALEHNYTSTVVDPTPDSQGYTLYTCVRCGSSYKDQYVEYVFGVWREYDGALAPDGYPTLTLNKDYTFRFVANLLEGMGNITGSYTIYEDIIHCYVSYRDFMGFTGDTLTELVFRVNGSELIYMSDYLGWTEPGASFKR